jgi:hypothetical protein
MVSVVPRDAAGAKRSAQGDPSRRSDPKGEAVTKKSEMRADLFRLEHRLDAALRDCSVWRKAADQAAALLVEERTDRFLALERDGLVRDMGVRAQLERELAEARAEAGRWRAVAKAIETRGPPLP